MNIKNAKEEIKNSITAYLTKDEDGEYIIPIYKQRPVFLMGPPGVGKTAIMEQIASELGIGILSYSMTHHTRQSALGLPFIEHKTYGGKEYEVSEYTMSEIIAAVYDLMENSNVKEGILFLDEINCVSETLAPVMLQFLQYKVFGRHQVPNGWVVVTAGNPPEYNDSVREFDIVTWDRLKRIDIEPEFDVWKDYAYKYQVHPAVITFLEIKRDYFYKIESTIDGKSFVTARGWDDLSQMIKIYEMHKFDIRYDTIIQYLQNPKIAREFAAYYSLFNKYKSDYQVEDILAGKYSQEIVERAKKSRFDERISLVGLILSRIIVECDDKWNLTLMTDELLKSLRNFVIASTKTNDYVSAMNGVIADEQKALNSAKVSGSVSRDEIRRMKKKIAALEGIIPEIRDISDRKELSKIIKDYYNKQNKGIKKEAEVVKKQLENIFKFFEESFTERQEILVFITELTRNNSATMFVNKYGCDSFFKYNKDLLVYERQDNLAKEIETLDLDNLDLLDFE